MIFLPQICRGLCVSAVLTAGAYAGSLDQLMTDTPFLPKDQAGAGTGAAAEDAVLEFRGMMTTKSGTVFGLYDKASKEVAWVRQGETGGNFTVTHFDAADNMLAVEHGGRRVSLPLASAVIAVAKSTASATPRPASAANNKAVPGVARGNVQGGARQNAGAASSRVLNLQSLSEGIRAQRALRQTQSGESSNRQSRQSGASR